MDYVWLPRRIGRYSDLVLASFPRGTHLSPTWRLLPFIVLFYQWYLCQSFVVFLAFIGLLIAVLLFMTSRMFVSSIPMVICCNKVHHRRNRTWWSSTCWWYDSRYVTPHRLRDRLIGIIVAHGFLYMLIGDVDRTGAWDRLIGEMEWRRTSETGIGQVGRTGKSETGIGQVDRTG